MTYTTIKNILNPKVLTLIVAVVVLSVSSIMGGRATAAGNATLSFSPSSGSVEIGKTITIGIDANSGSEAVNVVQADITYNASKFEFVSIGYEGTGFDFAVSGTGGGGTAQIVRGVSNGGSVTGTKRLASITFKALANSGTSQLNFAVGSAVVRVSDSENIWNEQPSPGNYTLKEATVAQTPAEQQVTEPSSPKPGSPAATSSQNIPDDQPVPVTGELDGDTSGGYLVTVQVFDEEGLGIPDLLVKLGDLETKTDSLGVASFASVPAGSYKVSAPGFDSETIEVVEGSKTQVQNFSLTRSGPDLARTIAKWLIIVAVVIAVIYLIRRYGRRIKGLFAGMASKRPKNSNANTTPENGTTQQNTSAYAPTNEIDETLTHVKGQDIPRPSETIEPQIIDKDSEN